MCFENFFSHLVESSLRSSYIITGWNIILYYIIHVLYYIILYIVLYYIILSFYERIILYYATLYQFNIHLIHFSNLNPPALYYIDNTESPFGIESDDKIEVLIKRLGKIDEDGYVGKKIITNPLYEPVSSILGTNCFYMCCSSPFKMRAV